MGGVTQVTKSIGEWRESSSIVSYEASNEADNRIANRDVLVDAISVNYHYKLRRRHYHDTLPMIIVRSACRLSVTVSKQQWRHSGRQ